MAIKTILITGADGLVGKRLVERLAGSPEYQISVFVRALRDTPLFEKHKVKVFLGNLKDRASIEQAAKGQDAIIHLIGTFQPEPGETLDSVNYMSTYNFHLAAQENKAQKFIFLSAYGASLGVKNAFLVSKGQAEVDIMQGEVPYVILRSTPIYGEESFFAAMLNSFAEKGSAPLIGTGKQQLQPIYVGDVVEYIYQALVGPAATQRVLEIGGPDKVTYEELIKLTGDVAGKPVQLRKGLFFFRFMQQPIKLANGDVPAARELVDFYSRDSFVSVDRAQLVIPVNLTLLRPGLQKSLKITQE